MAIIHNISNTSDILSCFDPVAGIVDGTTVGRSYMLRKIFDGLLAFDINIKEVTNASPTPAWLQPQAGNLTAALGATVNRSTLNDTVSFYFADDPGLLEATPNAFVYKLKIDGSVTSPGLCNLFITHVISGGTPTVYNPFTSSTGYNLTSSNSGEQIYYLNFGSATVTTMSQVPKVIFWRSGNLLVIQGVAKSNSAFAGALVIFKPNWTGYTRTGGSVNNSTFRAVAVANNNNGSILIEGIQQQLETAGAFNTQAASLQPISSCGGVPNALYTLAGIQRIIAGKLKVVVNNILFKTVSDEIEGALLCNSALYAASYIVAINSSYYVSSISLNDGKYTYRLLLQLS